MSATGPKVLISSRREDAGAHAARLYDEIAARLGEAGVLMDTLDLPHGLHFKERVREAVEECRVFLVVIGPDWAGLTDSRGQPRIADPGDHVRLELEAALRRPDLTVVPVLVGGARMPEPDELPETIRSLARRHALELSDSHWKWDVERLLSTLEGLAEPRTAPAAPSAQDVREAPTPSRLVSLLAEGARRGVLPADVLSSTATWAEGPTETAPPPAPRPPMSAPRSDLARSLLARAALLLVPLAALAAVLKWLTGCTLDPPLTSGDPSADEPVDCTVFAPASAAPGEGVLVQVFAHLPLQQEDARALASEFDPGTSRRGFKSLESRIARGSRLSFHLAMPGAEVDEPVQSLVWRGRAEAVQFGVTIGAGSPRTSLIGTVTVSQGSVPVGHVKFRLAVRPGATSQDKELQPVGDDARRYRTAFTSYASRDRDQVLRGVQLLRAAGIRCFQDVIDLEPGDRWERKLYSNIEESDLFLLFWSSAAKDSSWVRKEVEYALGCKADEFDPPEIKPIILERPLVPPWPELAHLHFDDRVVYFIGNGG